MLKFRRATELDRAIISLLGRVTFKETHDEFIEDKNEFQSYLNKAFCIEQITNELKDENNFFWIAYYHDLPIGYSKLVVNSNSQFLHEGSVARFERIYVLADFLHLKIGYQLQDLVLAKAKELQFDWIWLTVYVKNFRAINFYLKNGFKEKGMVDFSIGNKKYDNTVFAKRLI